MGSSRSRLALLLVLLGAAGCGGTGGEDAGIVDAGAVEDGSSDAAAADQDAGRPCLDHDCRLDCDPLESWLALRAETAMNPDLVAVGDPEQVPFGDIDDGQYHLFVGVLDLGVSEPGCDTGDAFIHDAVADAPEGPYSITSEPILPLTELDSYDQCGVETPSYLRVDASTEYIYYCALSAPVVGGIAALRRVDGGAWEKLGIVVPLGPGQSSQCEPDAAFDPKSGLYHLFYMSDFDILGVRNFGLFARTSEQPDWFDPASEVLILKYSATNGALARPSVSFDPYDRVWRFAFDVDGYVDPPVQMLVQTWAEVLLPGLWAWNDHGGVLHDPSDDLHTGLHLSGFGYAYHNSSAIYPDPDRVLFFYGGIVGNTDEQINVQVCRRR